MGTVAAGLYASLAVVLLASGAILYARESMASVPLYDAAAATDQEALARVLGLSLGALGVTTLAFAAVEFVYGAAGVAVSVYAGVVLCVALVTTLRTRKYE
jgi:hypothetical protein